MYQALTKTQPQLQIPYYRFIDNNKVFDIKNFASSVSMARNVRYRNGTYVIRIYRILENSNEYTASITNTNSIIFNSRNDYDLFKKDEEAKYRKLEARSK